MPKKIDILKRELVLAIRRATIILLWDRMRRDGVSLNDPSREVTLSKLSNAAAASGLMSSLDADDFREVFTREPNDWYGLISIIEHQLSYLTMASAGYLRTEMSMPAAQLAANPEAYAGFLAGVASSHQLHGDFIASLNEVSGKSTLVDLGGGFGAYSSAWVNSRDGRLAILSDLNGVEKILPNGIRADDRITFVGIDLLKRPIQLPVADVYLLANALHLIENWKDLILHLASMLHAGALLIIMEATPDDKSGLLFDLQVHMRSGYNSQLISLPEILETGELADLSLLKTYKTYDECDVFDRQYDVVVFSKPGLGGETSLLGGE